jgi:hypothetical protein
MMGATSDRSHGRSRADDQSAPLPADPPDDEEALDWRAHLGQTRHVDQRWLHRMNSAFVLTCVREHGPLTRVQIAAMTALSRATVTMITTELLREGALREGERLPSTARGGRRAILLYARARAGGE